MLSQNVALCNSHYLHYPLDRFLQHQKELRRSHILFYGCTPHLSVDHLTWSEAPQLGEKLKRAGFFVDAFLPANYGYSLLAQQRTDHFRASAQYYINCIYTAQALGASILTLRPQNGLLSESPSILMANCAALLLQLLPVAQEAHITLALGTSCYPESVILTTISELYALLELIHHPNLKAMLDTHAMAMSNETIPQWLNCFGDSLGYVLLADGRRRGYRPWGQGIYPMANYLRDLDSNGYHGMCACFQLDGPHAAQPESADDANCAGLLSLEGGTQ